MQSHSLPYIPVSTSNPTTSNSTSPFGESNSKPVTNKDVVENEDKNKPDPLANVKPVQYDNPWDFVPDQPTKLNTSGNSAKSNTNDSSSGISSTCSVNNQNNLPTISNAFDDDWVSKDADFAKDSDFWQEEEVKNANNKNGFKDLWSLNDSNGILDDPFDAEWAALATRKNNVNGENISAPNNPFRTTVQNHEEATEMVNGDENNFTAFELQM